MKARDLAGAIVKRYLASYRASDGVTQAACDLSEITALRHAVDRLAMALRNGLADPALRASIIQSRMQAQTYYVRDYVDLRDFCDLLRTNCAGSQSIVSATKAINQAVDKYVIASGAKGDEIANSHGVSIHFPADPAKKLSPLYENLDFAKEGNWRDFLMDWLASLPGADCRGGAGDLREKPMKKIIGDGITWNNAEDWDLRRPGARGARRSARRLRARKRK
jgi:hypothetical protein